MPVSRTFRFTVLFAAVIVAMLLLPLVADAQCSMCRAVLSSSNNAKFIRNFNIGVLVLLIPPVSMFCTIFIVLRRRSREEGASPDSGIEGPQQDRDADC